MSPPLSSRSRLRKEASVRFSKREKGLFKKVVELCILCGAQITITASQHRWLVSPNGEIRKLSEQEEVVKSPSSSKKEVGFGRGGDEEAGKRFTQERIQELNKKKKMDNASSLSVVVLDEELDGVFDDSISATASPDLFMLCDNDDEMDMLDFSDDRLWFDPSILDSSHFDTHSIQ